MNVNCGNFRREEESLNITKINLLNRFNKTREMFPSVTRFLIILLKTAATSASLERLNSKTIWNLKFSWSTNHGSRPRAPPFSESLDPPLMLLVVATFPNSSMMCISSTWWMRTSSRTARVVKRSMFSLLFLYLITTFPISPSLLNSISLTIPYW